MNRSIYCAPCLLLIAVWGCAEQNSPSTGGRYDLGDRVLASTQAGGQPAAAKPVGGAVSEPPPKKIIHTATIDLSVEDFSVAEKKIARQVREASGYVADFREGRVQGTRTSGRWMARVPAERFDAF